MRQLNLQWNIFNRDSTLNPRTSSFPGLLRYLDGQRVEPEPFASLFWALGNVLLAIANTWYCLPPRHHFAAVQKHVLIWSYCSWFNSQRRRARPPPVFLSRNVIYQCTVPSMAMHDTTTVIIFFSSHPGNYNDLHTLQIIHTSFHNCCTV